LAPNETRQLRWKAFSRKPMGGTKRWEVVVQIGVAQLHNVFGSGQIAQRV
jgi:hypothetical protein